MTSPAERIAALYIDPRGPYPSMPGVECWDEERDATTYAGPWPVVAHPPCGPWGKLAHMCKHQRRDLGPLAVEQVRRWGGVLEHPEASRLWRECQLPRPGELPDGYGGWSLAVRQCDWGHVCAKPTWLYMVGVPCGRMALPPRREPVAAVTNSDRPYLRGRRRATALETRATPPAFAEWLVRLARASRKVARVDLRVSNHDFRHAALTRWGELTDNLVGMAYLAGHKHVTTTAKYVHANRRAAERVLSIGTRVGTHSPDSASRDEDDNDA